MGIVQKMRRSTTFAISAALLPAVLALAACSSSSTPSASAASSTASAPTNNIGLTSNQLGQALDNATSSTSITALKVTGTIDDHGVAATLNMQYNQDTAAGTVSVNSLQVQTSVIDTDDTFYFQATPSVLAFLTSGGNTTTVTAGQWIPSGSAEGTTVEEALWD